MNRVLVIDQDQERVQSLGMEGLRRGIAVAIAENVCEGVRVLDTAPISLILVDASRLRLTAAEHAAVFERVAPGVPVVVAIDADMPAHLSAVLEQAGFRTLARPVGLDDVLGEVASERGEVATERDVVGARG